MLTMMVMMVSVAMHGQTPERSSWAMGIHGMAEAGIVRGSVGVPIALGTAPGTAYQDATIVGGMTYGVGMQFLVTVRPPDLPTSASLAVGMQRRHIAASGTVGEPFPSDLGERHADLYRDQTVLMAAVDGRYCVGGAWHVVGALGMELPLGNEQVSLWLYETGTSVGNERLQRRSGVRYRSVLDGPLRMTFMGGLARDIVVGIHGNSGAVLTPQIGIVTGTSLVGTASWYPIVVRMGVALTWEIK